MDGKGGYLAMVHPRETITDNTKSGSGGNTIIVNVSGNNAPDVRRAAAQGAREGMAMMNGARRYA
jgi:hypothetical protein